MGRASEAAGSFAAGLVMTLVLVIVVPVVIDEYMRPVIEGAVGDSTFLTLSSSFIVMVLVWCVMFGFMALLGSGGIMRRFGIFGILGLVAAYYLLGDVTQAAVPVLSLIAVSLVLWIHRKSKEKKDGGRGKRTDDDRGILD